MLKGNSSESVNFLRWLRPAGPWVLTAIEPDRGSIDTQTFDVDSIPQLTKWVEANNGKRNCYFMVNKARTRLSKKASKEDVEAMEFLHVDLDPPKGAPWEPAREEIMSRLRAFPAPPSAVIDSGGGYQAFWRLDEAVHIGGVVARAEEVESYNKQLELVLKGDHCFNTDRILRLPGTVNLPDAKKRAAGRIARVAVVVGQLTDLTYPLDTFTAAPRQQTTSSGPSAPSTKVTLSGNLSPILVDDLPEGVTQRIKMLIVQGNDPDDPTKYASRSEAAWAVMCGLIRGGCDDNTVAAIMLDKDYAISAHVLAQKRPIEYLERQLQRAREDVIEPMLRTLNERHAVISDMGGKCRIISETMDHAVKPPRPKISKQSFEDFRNRYMNVRVVVGKDKDGEPITMSAGKWWLLHPLRRQYDTLVFAPNQEVEGAYNLWQGFACEAIPGKNHEPYLEHLFENICSGDQTNYDYLIRWMARGVQQPGSQGEVAVVMRGGRGAGKGTVASTYGALWGRHFIHISSAKHLVGQFNAHLRDCCFLFADEAFFAGDKQHEGALKTLVTENVIMVEPKGVDAEMSPNYIHLMMSSNQDWVVPAGEDERRYFVLEVSEARKQDTAYFKGIRDALANGGRESLLHYLLTLDLSDFEVRNVPKTEGLQTQKIHSLNAEESWWLERLTDGRITAVNGGWTPEIQKQLLMGDYFRFAEQQRLFRRSTPTQLGIFLKKVLPAPFPRSVQRTVEVEQQLEGGEVALVRERIYFYELPSLDETRAHWEAKFGKFDWPQDEIVDPQDSKDPY